MEKIAIRRNTIKVQRQGSTCHHHSFPWIRTTILMARGPLEPEAYNMQDVNTRMKHSKEQQKYCCNCQYIKELLPVRPGDHVRVIPGPGSDYITKVVGIIRRWPKNQTKQTRDSESARQTLSDSGNAHAVPTFQANTHVEHRNTTQILQLTRKVELKVNHSSRVKGSAPYITRSGTQVKKPVKLKFYIEISKAVFNC